MKRSGIIFFVLLVVSCSSQMPPLDYRPKDSANLIINNPSGYNIVLFAGAVSGKKVLGCIPARSTNFGLRKEGAGGLLVGMTDIEYLNNRRDIEKAKVLFSCFIDKTTGKTNLVEIQGVTDGFGLFEINNTTDWYLELRAGGWTNSVVMVVEPGEIRRQKMHLRDYDIFPLAFADKTAHLLERPVPLSNSILTFNLSLKPIRIEVSASGKKFLPIE